YRNAPCCAAWVSSPAPAHASARPGSRPTRGSPSAGSSRIGVQFGGQPRGERVEGAVPGGEIPGAWAYAPLRLETDLGPCAEPRPQLELDRDPSVQPWAAQRSVQSPRAAPLAPPR